MEVKIGKKDNRRKKDDIMTREDDGRAKMEA